MPRRPSIPHQAIIDFIMEGHTTRQAKDQFGFSNDNIANLRVHAAFKAMGIPRPRYSEPRTCEFCGQRFVARDFRQRTCGASSCQIALIEDWNRSNPEVGRESLKKYRRTEKGHENSRRAHRRIREGGLHGSSQERWYFALWEIKKSLRKLVYLATRSPWEYRFHQVQNFAKFERQFTPRNKRKIESKMPSAMWREAFRALDTILRQYRITAASSVWEIRVNKISAALRTGHEVRKWKRKQKQSRKQFHSTT